MARPRNKRHRLLIAWSVRSGVVSLAVIALALAARRGGEDGAVVPGAAVDGLTSILTRDESGGIQPIRFREVSQELGVAFRHFLDQRGSVLPEDMGSGVACGDFDGDGFTDLYFVNFAAGIVRSRAGTIAAGNPPDSPLGKGGGVRGVTPPLVPPLERGDEGTRALGLGAEAGSRLYRNVHGERFEDVTARAGVGFTGYGMGAAWGDFDNDGDLDLYVTAYGRNVLYENLGDGSFRDVTAAAGVGDARFSAGCAWGDYDRDGALDLYVCNYVDFTYRASDRSAVARQYDTEQPYTLNPSAYAPQLNALFHNNRDGTFTDVAATVGVTDPGGRSLSVSWVDFDNDGWSDLYVANDVSNNGVFRNRGDGTFEDIGPKSLAADYRGAMGIAVADFDDDLDQDLLITHWIAQENALFRNMTLDPLAGDATGGTAWFMDVADTLGLGQISLDMVGWATGFCDLDNDGLRDLWVVNGSTLESSEDHSALVAQTPFVFRNRGDDGFEEVAGSACPALADRFVGRGGAQLDFDRDGLVDWVLLVHGEWAKVLQNVSRPSGNWVRLVLRQTGGNTHAIGARVYVTADGSVRMADVGVGGSYLSQNESALHFGLGDAERVDSVRIVWPDGEEESLSPVEMNRPQVVIHEAHYPVAPVSYPPHARLHGCTETHPSVSRSRGSVGREVVQ